MELKTLALSKEMAIISSNVRFLLSTGYLLYSPLTTKRTVEVPMTSKIIVEEIEQKFYSIL